MEQGAAVSKEIPVFLLCIALAGGCAKTPEPACSAPGHIDLGECNTAILNILVSPRSYEGKTVSVLGFVDVIADGNAEVVLLYPSRDARAMGASTTAIQVVGDERQLARIRGRHRVDAAAHATGVFVEAPAGRGVVGEIRLGR